jgi:ABC-type Na+ efflux pump permease subunit
MTEPRHIPFSPARIGAIAGNTLLELVRLKVFHFLLLFALAVIGSSSFMVKFSFQEQFQVLRDVGFGAMSIFTFLLAILPTALLLPRDVEDRTLYTILAKPVPRVEYLLGKLLGVLVLLAIATALMSAVFAATLHSRFAAASADTLREFAAMPQDQKDAALRDLAEHAFTPGAPKAVALIYIKAALFAGFTLFISTFATSHIFTIIVVASTYLIGHLQGVARDYWQSGEAISPLKKLFLAAVALAFPDLQPFNVVDELAVGTLLPDLVFAKVFGLGALYLAVYTLLAWFVFEKKEL